MMAVYICSNFLENILDGIKVIGKTFFPYEMGIIF